MSWFYPRRLFGWPQRSLESARRNSRRREKKINAERFELREKRRRFSMRLPAMKNIIYFDLETQKSADEVGGWNNIRDMRMSIGVTYSTARGDYKIYGEKEVD